MASINQYFDYPNFGNSIAGTGLMTVRTALGILFLLAQLALVAYARFVPTRWL